MSVADQLRRAIKGSKQTLYRVAKGSSVNYSVLFHFVKHDSDIRVSTVGQLCDYLGLELTSKKGGDHGKR